MPSVPLSGYKNFKPIKYNLSDEDRTLDLSVPSYFTSREGASLYEYGFLLSANDVKNKNYTTNFLTYKNKEEDIFDLNFPQPLNNSIVTPLQFSLSSTRYLCLCANDSQESSINFLSGSLSPSNSALHNYVINLSSNDNNLKAQIFTYDGIYKKYLAISDLYSEEKNLIFISTDENDLRTFFDISIYNNRAILYNTLSSTQTLVFPYYNDTTNVSYLTGIDVTLIDKVSTFEDSIFYICNRILDTDYFKYSNNFVYYISSFEIDREKTLSGQDYNFIFYNDYENNYLSGENFNAKVNYFNLKNQISNKGNVNKDLPYSNKQEQRYYTNILNNETTETSNEFLELNYNFYGAEYNFKPDKYTKFVMPDSLHPFDKININDSDIQKSGSLAGQSPYFSDRVYKILNDNTHVNKENEDNGTYLCTWLHDDGLNGKWYDRYYFPAYLTTAEASLGFLKLTPDKLLIETNPFFLLEDSNKMLLDVGEGIFFTINPDNNMLYEEASTNYKTQIQRIKESLEITNFNYYDVESSLVFEPSGTYFYARVGPKYIDKILDGRALDLIRGGFSPYSPYTERSLQVTDTFVLNGSSYDVFTVN